MLNDKIKERINLISQKIYDLQDEKKTLESRLSEIEVRMHQLVGALYELQSLISKEDDEAKED